MVEIPETILFGAAMGIFVPLFIFLIKMIMEQANTKNRIDLFQAHLEDAKDELKRLVDIETDFKILKVTIKGIESDIADLFRKSRSSSSRNKSNMNEGEEENGGGRS